MAELRVSVECYNEIANALEAQGRKIEPGAKITLEKDDKIINPLDWRLITLRRDVANVVSQAKISEESFQSSVQNLYDFVLNGPTTAKW